MQLNELGYNTSERDKVFQVIWNIIGDNYNIKPSPVKNVVGNVIVLPDEIYWECDKIVKLNHNGFKQKWTMYRPSIFAIKHNLVKKGALIYNESWYNKYLSGEVQQNNLIKQKIAKNVANVEEISKVKWEGLDLSQIGIWGIKLLNDKVVGLYLSLDEEFNNIWKREQEQETLICYDKYKASVLKYESVLTVADMVKGNNNLSREDMALLHLGLCKVLKPEEVTMRRKKGVFNFNFSNTCSDEFDYIEE